MSRKSDDDEAHPSGSDDPQENRSLSISMQISRFIPATKTISIPSNLAGVVIGENWRRINTIRGSSGANINIDNLSMESESGVYIKKVHLTGFEEQISCAEDMINFVLETFEARGIRGVLDVTSLLYTMDFPRKKAIPAEGKLRISGTPEETETGRENDEQVLRGGRGRVPNDKGKGKVAYQGTGGRGGVWNDKGKQNVADHVTGAWRRVPNNRGKLKVADQENKSHDDMAADTKQTNFDTSNGISAPNAEEQTDSSSPITTPSPYQPYDQSQIRTGYWASNQQAEWYYPGPTHMPVLPQRGYMVNPASQHAYGAQPAYGWQQGYAGSGGYASFPPSNAPVAQGYYPVQPAPSSLTNHHASHTHQGYAGSGGYYGSFAPSYAPAVQQIYPFARGGYPVQPAPSLLTNHHASYTQSGPWIYAQPRPRGHIAGPDHAGTSSQGYGSWQVYMNHYAPCYQSFAWTQAQPQAEAHISEPNHAGNASQGYGAVQVDMDPSNFCSQSSLPQAQPQTEAHISEPNHAGAASQGQDSSEVSHTTSHPSSKAL